MQVHVIAFEGPDPYAQAGGIATRVTGLTQAFADAGLQTYLWIVGDPTLPGHEIANCLQLHRWCQWISRYHPGGVYDGEEGKRADYARSLPPVLCQDVLLPYVRRGGQAVILAEERNLGPKASRKSNASHVSSALTPTPRGLLVANNVSHRWTHCPLHAKVLSLLQRPTEASQAS